MRFEIPDSSLTPSFTTVIQQTLLDLGREMSTKRAEGKVFPSKGMSQFESYEKFNKERTKFLEIVRKDIGIT